MSFPAPSPSDLVSLATHLGLPLSPEQAGVAAALLAPYAAAYDAVDAMTPASQPDMARASWGVPAENPFNAWTVTGSLQQTAAGPLAGRSVVLKDNILLAGAPMMNGSDTLRGYVPEVDATVVTRVLEAGGTIIGKGHCEGFCMSAGSHTGIDGPVHNPLDPTRTSGGSSSGVAALVASGAAEMAIGGDQGGSIRIPASFCGLVGMKPTHGLVPYSGIMAIEPQIDHTGPITRTVADNALLLSVLAGPDGMDARQMGLRTGDYAAAPGQPVKGLRVGILAEGFGHPNADPEVEACVRAAADRLRAEGVEVVDVSNPMHHAGPAIWVPLGVEGMTQTMMLGDGFATGRADMYVPSLAAAHRSWRTRTAELPPTVTSLMLLGLYVNERFGAGYYGKAANLARALRASYDALLTRCDALILPTTVMTAPPLPTPQDGIEGYFARAAEALANTSPFNVSHHPALSVPSGTVGGMPVGMQIVGRMWDEPTLYRLAAAVEATSG